MGQTCQHCFGRGGAHAKTCRRGVVFEKEPKHSQQRWRRPAADAPFWVLVLQAMIAHTEEHGQSDFTKQEVAVVAFEAHPSAFCLRGYPDLVDSNRVYVILFRELKRAGRVQCKRVDGENYYSVARVPDMEHYRR